MERDSDRWKEARSLYYDHIFRNGNFCSWRGVRVVKFPTDLMLYAEMIHRNRPDWIVEKNFVPVRK